MSKRVFELAKEIDLSTKEILAKAQTIGIELKNNFATLSEKQVNLIKESVKNPISSQTSAAKKLSGVRRVRKKIEAVTVVEKTTKKVLQQIETEVGTTEPISPKSVLTKQQEVLSPKVVTEKVEAKDKIEYREEVSAKATKPDEIIPSTKEGMPRIRKATEAEQEIIRRNLKQKTSNTPHKKAKTEDKNSSTTELKSPQGTKEEVKPVATPEGSDFDKSKKHKKKTKVFIEEEDDDGSKVSSYVKQYDQEKKVLSKVVRSKFVKRNEPKRNEKKHIFNPRKKEFKITGAISIGELASLIGIKAPQIIKSLMALEIMATINQTIDTETAQLVASENGIDLKIEEKTIEDNLLYEDKEENLTTRPPVITIMGHVDHGKTSLLDSLRKTNIVSGESGGITQHIGAYSVKTNHGLITFLDTPGHAAFSSMRARGANTTDIVIIVVSADDGPMPQTIEAINHAKAAEVPIIVAINKCDKPDANPTKVMTQLMEHGLICEDMGGDIIMVNVSAKSGEGLDKLLEMISLQAEIMELKADKKRPAEGVVVESKVDKGRGNVATILIQKGTLKVGDHFVSGSQYGKIRRLVNDQGKVVKEGLPSAPIEIVGLNGLPESGDTFVVTKDEKLARQISEERVQREKNELQALTKKASLDDFFSAKAEGHKSVLNLIVKTDVKGSQEALNQSFLKLGNDEVSVKIIHSDVGAITMSDITLASASQAFVIGFNVRPENNAKGLAEKHGIEIRTYSVIYDAIDDITKALEGLLQPIIKEEIQGSAEIREIFSIPKVGIISGVYIKEGKATRNSKIRILRNNIVIHDGKMVSLKRFKDDAKEVTHGYECGIGIDNFKDIQVGDSLEFYTLVEEVAKLKN